MSETYAFPLDGVMCSPCGPYSVTHTYTHTHTDTQTHIYIHTHTHTHTRCNSSANRFNLRVWKGQFILP
jgi:hypothetical protein